MTPSPAKPEACIARVFCGSGPEAPVAGLGFLCAPSGTLLTCAHVVAAALGFRPEDAILPDSIPAGTEIEIDFPFLAPGRRWMARLERLVPPGVGPGDLALLRLVGPCPEGAGPCSLARLDQTCGVPIEVFGFPRGHERGIWAKGVLGPHVLGEFLQVNCDPQQFRNAVRQGFSGGPAFDHRRSQVLGMVTDADPDSGTALILPAWAFARVWPDCQWPLSTRFELGRLVNVPSPPPNYLSRPDDLARLKDLLLTDLGGTTAVTAASGVVGVQGMGGIGKTVLAAALAQDPDVRRQFPDGLFWLVLGQQASVLLRQHDLVRAAGGNPTACLDVTSAKAELARLLADRACLVVLDDVWRLEHALAFYGVLGPWGRLVITTRNLRLVQALGARDYAVDLLDPEQARMLLARSTGMDPAGLPAEAEAVIAQCGRLPLALAMIGAMIRRRPEAWTHALRRLEQADLGRIRADFPDYPYPDLLRAIEVSVEGLTPQLLQRYLDLAVFPEDFSLPEAVLQTFWQALGLEEDDVTDAIDALVDLSLVRKDPETKRLGMHDLQYDYVRRQARDTLAERRDRLLAAYRKTCPEGWHTLADDGYFVDHLAWHLRAAGRSAELFDLLTDFRWLAACLKQKDPNRLLGDYQHADPDSGLDLVAAAVRLGSNALARDPAELPSQLFGRLEPGDGTAAERVLESTLRHAQGPWLHPLRATLTAPGPMQRILDGHAASVLSVAVSADGRRVVSGSEDRTVRVWDLDSGACLRTLEGHAERVLSVAVSADGSRALSGSWDRTVRVWDLARGACLRTLEGRADWVRSVAVSADGSRAVSGSGDRTVRVWDLDSGGCLRTLEGHADWVRSVAVSADGSRAVSCSEDRTVRVWDLTSGACLRTLEGHRHGVTSVAVSADGGRAVSASGDGRVRVWDLQSGACLRFLAGHGGCVRCVAVSADGSRAVSGSDDRTVRVWDLQSGACLRTLEGHAEEVLSVAVSADGSRAVSGSSDRSVRVWDLHSGREIGTFTADAEVRACAMTPDGRTIVAGDRLSRVHFLRLELPGA